MRNLLLSSSIALLAAAISPAIAQTSFADKEHAADVRFDACKAHLQKAKQDGILLDLKWAERKGDAHVSVSVSFAALPADAKQTFARDVNCFMTAGEEGQSITFDLVEPQSDRRLGRWDGTELIVF